MASSVLDVLLLL